MKVSDHVLADVVHVIEWHDSLPGTMVWRFCDRAVEIRYGAKLLVYDHQQALFFTDNILADIYNPGLYTLNAENMPRLTALSRSELTPGHAARADVYFIKTKYFIEQLWSLKGNILQQTGFLPLNFCGTYDVKIINSRKLISRMRDEASFDTSQVTAMIEKMIASMLPGADHTKEFSASMAEENTDLAGFIQESINIEFNNYGLLVRNLTISISDR